MPLYDYQCDRCGHRFEVRQGIKEDPLRECPQCGGPIRRVIHPVGIVFKGSGFYITDSRNKSSASTPTSGDGAEKKASSEGAESKPKSAEAGAARGGASSSSGESKSA